MQKQKSASGNKLPAQLTLKSRQISQSPKIPIETSDEDDGEKKENFDAISLPCVPRGKSMPIAIPTPRKASAFKIVGDDSTTVRPDQRSTSKKKLYLYTSEGYSSDPKCVDEVETVSEFSSKLFKYCAKQSQNMQLIISTEERVTLKESDKMNVCRYKAGAEDKQNDASVKNFIGKLMDALFNMAQEGQIYSIVTKLWPNNGQLFHVNVHSKIRLETTLANLDCIKEARGVFYHDHKSPYDTTSPYRKEIPVTNTRAGTLNFSDSAKFLHNFSNKKAPINGSRIVPMKSNKSREKTSKELEEEEKMIDGLDNKMNQIEARKDAIMAELISKIKDEVTPSNGRCLDLILLLSPKESSVCKIVRTDDNMTKIRKLITHIEAKIEEENSAPKEVRQFSPPQCSSPMKRMLAVAKDPMKEFESSKNKLGIFGETDPTKEKDKEQLEKNIQKKELNKSLILKIVFSLKVASPENRTKMCDGLISAISLLLDQQFAVQVRDYGHTGFVNLMELILDECSCIPSFYPMFIERYLILVMQCVNTGNSSLTDSALQAKMNKKAINASHCLADILLRKDKFYIEKSKEYLDNKIGVNEKKNKLAKYSDIKDKLTAVKKILFDKTSLSKNLVNVVLKYYTCPVNILRYNEVIMFLLSLETETSIRCAIIFLTQQKKLKTGGSQMFYRVKLAPQFIQYVKQIICNFKFEDNESLEYLIMLFEKAKEL